MKTIWKYEINVPQTRLLIPKGSKVLKFDLQYKTLCIWVEVWPGHEKEARYFYIFGTGHPMEMESLSYVGSAMEGDGGLVWHLYEEKKSDVATTH